MGVVVGLLGRAGWAWCWCRWDRRWAVVGGELGEEVLSRLNILERSLGSGNGHILKDGRNSRSKKQSS